MVYRETSCDYFYCRHYRNQTAIIYKPDIKLNIGTWFESVIKYKIYKSSEEV